MGDDPFQRKLPGVPGTRDRSGQHCPKVRVKVFEIHTAFPIDSGNVYQDKRVNFSLTLYIQGEESGTGEVLSTSTSSSSSSSPSSSSTGDSVNSLIGQVLGLSDTGGLFVNLFYLTSGLFLIILGLKSISESKITRFR
jgi:hypothetical protein